jgi:hypothetical protein
MPVHLYVFIAIATALFTGGIIVGAVLARRTPPPPRPRRLNDAAILQRINADTTALANAPAPAPPSTLGVLVRAAKDERGVETLEWIAIGALVVAAALVVFAAEVQPGLSDAAHRLRMALP